MRLAGFFETPWSMLARRRARRSATRSMLKAPTEFMTRTPLEEFLLAGANDDAGAIPPPAGAGTPLPR